eukprot:CAMPEP_0119276492 /NCGR_PEP_ID=MMETSP1329-20130426/15549_1 /TAXON_ID=114041 /ORGANISM="Genus nov. species nov., Strain RCC1024" /LENGTH=208 /DNA_ID=CAMNT_0007276923 /DNA_START=46 /DNA_END=668 /DNA_ORIENTATION=+
MKGTPQAALQTAEGPLLARLPHAEPGTFAAFRDLLARRQVPFMGRTVDVGYVVARRADGFVDDDSEAVVRALEASVAHAPACVAALRVLKRARDALEGAGAAPADFARALENVDGRTEARQGRIARAAARGVCSDLVPRYRYCRATGRFTKSKVSVCDDDAPRRARDPSHVLPRSARALGDAWRLSASFVGLEHARALDDLLAPGGGR